MLCLQNWEGNVLTETFTQSQKQIPSSACRSTFVTVGISSREQAVISLQLVVVVNKILHIFLVWFCLKQKKHRFYYPSNNAHVYSIE